MSRLSPKLFPPNNSLVINIKATHLNLKNDQSSSGLFSFQIHNLISSTRLASNSRTLSPNNNPPYVEIILAQREKTEKIPFFSFSSEEKK